MNYLIIVNTVLHSSYLLFFVFHISKLCFFLSSEGSSSPVPRAEAVINRTNESISQPVTNPSLQHIQSYPSNTIDTSANDNIEHYHHHQSSNDV